MNEKDMEMEEFQRSLDEFCAGTEETYVSPFRPDVGRYRIIRSSEDENAMLYWNMPEFDKSCGRWFESCGCGFCSWRDCQAFQEADDMEMAMFHADHPDICVRESFCEIKYGETHEIIENISYLLIDYRGTKHRSFSFDINHVSKDELTEWEAAVRNWHATGEVKTEHFACHSMHWAWREN